MVKSHCKFSESKIVHMLLGYKTNLQCLRSWQRETRKLSQDTCTNLLPHHFSKASEWGLFDLLVSFFLHFALSELNTQFAKAEHTLLDEKGDQLRRAVTLSKVPGDRFNVRKPFPTFRLLWPSFKYEDLLQPLFLKLVISLG